MMDEAWSATFEIAECRRCSGAISRDPVYWNTSAWVHESNRETECPDQTTTRRHAAPRAGTRRVIPREGIEDAAES